MANVSFRAAEYFGMQREPRTSIKVGRRKCIVVAERRGRMAMALYDEEYRPTGEYVWLTDEQREALITALEGYDS